MTATSETITGLVAGTSYDFRVTPVNASGSGTPTIEAGITTAAVPATTPLTDTGYYAVAITEGLHRGAFVVRESNGFRSRERATLNNSGSAAVYYPPGLVVALSGVPGAYTVAPFTNSGTATTARRQTVAPSGYGQTASVCSSCKSVSDWCSLCTLLTYLVRFDVGVLASRQSREAIGVSAALALNRHRPQRLLRP